MLPTPMSRMSTDFAPVVSKSAIRMQSAHGPVWVVNSCEEIAPSLWQSAFAEHGKDSRFYQIIERTLRGQFDHRYFVLQNEATGEVAVQPFFFVDQDVTAGSPRILRELMARLRKLFPRFLVMRMLMVGCAAGEGQLSHTSQWAVEALHDALTLYKQHADASVILLKDFPSTYRDALMCFSTNGYARVPSMPAAVLDLRGFTSFEDYLQRKVGKVFRKNLRRKFKKLADQPPITMEVVEDATPHLDEIFQLYHQTFSRSEFQFEELNKDYFRQLGEQMPDRVRYFLWRQNGRLIAFNLCLIHDDVLYDLDVGLDYSVALDLHMYYVTWRDIVQWAIENGLRMYHTGPLNYDPKLHLRLDLAPQDLYARHASNWINPLFKIAIKYLQPVRHDPTLRQFSNAHEMEC